jgi:hypothetical protein
VTPNIVTLIAASVLAHRIQLKKNKKYPRVTSTTYLNNLINLRVLKPA